MIWQRFDAGIGGQRACLLIDALFVGPPFTDPQKTQAYHTPPPTPARPQARHPHCRTQDTAQETTNHEPTPHTAVSLLSPLLLLTSHSTLHLAPPLPPDRLAKTSQP